jgi:succinyl-CoA synthetase beta subunit
MDLIKLHGAEPANFLDIGGGATAGQVSEALSIIISDEKVKAIMVNIFGGITRCDDVARGLTDVIQEMKLDIPMVIRLVGTNEKEGRAILEKIGIKTAATLNEAAKKVVELVGE